MCVIYDYTVVIPGYRIPGSCLLISSLPDLALRRHVESLGRASQFNKHSQSLAW